MNRTLLFGAVLCVSAFPPTAHAQAHEVTGKVLETVTGLPIPNAEVGVVGQEGGACTNARGEYRLRVPIGNVPVLVRANGFNVAFIKLAPTDTTADFVIQREAAPQPVIVIGGVMLTEFSAPEPLIVVNGVMVSNPPSGCPGRSPTPRGTGAS